MTLILLPNDIKIALAKDTLSPEDFQALLSPTLRLFGGDSPEGPEGDKGPF